MYLMFFIEKSTAYVPNSYATEAKKKKISAQE